MSLLNPSMKVSRRILSLISNLNNFGCESINTRTSTKPLTVVFVVIILHQYSIVSECDSIWLSVIIYIVEGW